MCWSWRRDKEPHRINYLCSSSTGRRRRRQKEERQTGGKLHGQVDSKKGGRREERTEQEEVKKARSKILPSAAERRREGGVTPSTTHTLFVLLFLSSNTHKHTHSIPSIHWFSTSYIHPTFPSAPPPPSLIIVSKLLLLIRALFHLLFPPLLFTLSPEQETRGRVGQWLTPSSCRVIVNVRMWVNARACARARPRHSLPPVKRLIQAAMTRGSLVWAFSSLTGAKTTDSFMSFYSMWYFILCDVFLFFLSHMAQKMWGQVKRTDENPLSPELPLVIILINIENNIYLSAQLSSFPQHLPDTFPWK